MKRGAYLAAWIAAVLSLVIAVFGWAQVHPTRWPEESAQRLTGGGPGTVALGQGAIALYPSAELVQSAAWNPGVVERVPQAVAEEAGVNCTASNRGEIRVMEISGSTPTFEYVLDALCFCGGAFIDEAPFAFEWICVHLS